MSNFILYLIIIFSFFGILIILARKIPTIAQLSEGEVAVLSKKKGLIKKSVVKIKKIDYSSYKNSLASYSEAFFGGLKTGLVKIKDFIKQAVKWIGQRIGYLGLQIKQGTKKISQLIKDLINSIKIKIKKYQEKRQVQKTVIEETPEEFSEEAMIEKDLADKEEVKKEEIKSISFADLEKPIQPEQELIDLIVQNPKNIIAYKALGLLYWKQHNYQDAKASLGVAIKLGSNDKKIKEILEEIKKIDNNND